MARRLFIYGLLTAWGFVLGFHFMVSARESGNTRPDLDEFVECFNPANRHERRPNWSEETPDGRWRDYGYDELMARDKVNLDIFWLRDESLEATDNLPDPDIIAEEIVEDLEAALEQFRLIAEDLNKDTN